MGFTAQSRLSDWFAGSDPISVLLWTAYVFVVVSSALIGGFVTGFAFQHVARLIVRDLSVRAVSRARMIGGVVAAILAVMLLNPGWLGLGGGGASGPEEQGSAKVQPTSDPKPSEEPPPQPQPPTLAEKASGNGIVRILILGPETQPPWQEKNRYFAFLDDPMPEALDVGEVMKRIESLRQQKPVREVELVVVPQSTSPRNIPVQSLRSELQAKGLRVYVPPELP
ncbi:MAG: hypothetical protein NZM31_10090 [Gemmatales bacterium]|nr:hypothetical protein [Gemmatales bacterium]MDW8387345.1 hypothetical protein [Gemmatales bacterium]